VLLARADMRRFALRARFPLIVAPFNVFQHLYTHLDIDACLRCAREHLLPGGHLAFDVLQPDLRWLTRDPDRRWARTLFTHPTTGRRVEYTTNQTYDPIGQVAYVRIYYKDVATGRERVVRLTHRQFFPAELAALIAHAGFDVVARWGGFDRQPFAGESESQVLVCRAREK
jgi:hypothetical protein